MEEQSQFDNNNARIMLAVAVLNHDVSEIRRIVRTIMLDIEAIAKSLRQPTTNYPAAEISFGGPTAAPNTNPKGDDHV